MSVDAFNLLMFLVYNTLALEGVSMSETNNNVGISRLGLSGINIKDFSIILRLNT